MIYKVEWQIKKMYLNLFWKIFQRKKKCEQVFFRQIKDFKLYVVSYEMLMFNCKEGSDIIIFLYLNFGVIVKEGLEMEVFGGWVNVKDCIVVVKGVDGYY